VNCHHCQPLPPKTTLPYCQLPHPIGVAVVAVTPARQWLEVVTEHVDAAVIEEAT
jgi:hypothetical protein